MSKTTYYIGIDPGASGGIATLAYEGTTLRCVSAIKMPSTEAYLWDELSMLPPRNKCRVVLEKVGGYISAPDGGFVAGSSAMFNFGWNCGGIYMALTGLGFISESRFEHVTSQTWQKTLGVPPRIKSRKTTKSGPAIVGETKTQFKNRLKQLAQGLFPQVSVTLATADSLLLARYCYLKWAGT